MVLAYSKINTTRYTNQKIVNIDLIMGKISKSNWTVLLFLVMITVILIMYLTFESKAEGIRFSKGCGPACRFEVSSDEHKSLDLEDDHNRSDEEDQSGHGYDFYRQYGDVPSPGIGH